MEDDGSKRETDGRERSTRAEGHDETTCDQHHPEPRSPATATTQEALQERIDQAVTHSDARLASSRAASARSQARIEASNAQVGRVAALLSRNRALMVELKLPRRMASTTESGSNTEHLEALRRQCSELGLKFAKLEEQIAEQHETMAANRPGRRTESLRIAAEARRGAEHARELVRRFQAAPTSRPLDPIDPIDPGSVTS